MKYVTRVSEKYDAANKCVTFWSSKFEVYEKGRETLVEKKQISSAEFVDSLRATGIPLNLVWADLVERNGFSTERQLRTE